MTIPIMIDHPIQPSGSGGGSSIERLLVLCDFDGTVYSVDMGNTFLERFAEGWEETILEISATAWEKASRTVLRNRPEEMDKNTGEPY
jgi:hypothetical protein